MTISASSQMAQANLLQWNSVVVRLPYTVALSIFFNIVLVVDVISHKMYFFLHTFYLKRVFFVYIFVISNIF